MPESMIITAMRFLISIIQSHRAREDFARQEEREHAMSANPNRLALRNALALKIAIRVASIS